MTVTANSPDLVRVLRQRSTEIAARTMDQTEIEIFAEVVVVERAGVLLGIPISAVSEVRSVEFTALPHSTAVVAGLFQIRGQTFCLIDIASFFGDASALEHGDRNKVILVRGTAGEIGIRIDEVIGPRVVASHEIEDGVHGGTVDFISHVTHDLVQLIDVNKMLSLPAMRIRVSP